MTSKSELVQPAATKAHGKKELIVADPYKQAWKNVIQTSTGLMALMALGY